MAERPILEVESVTRHFPLGSGLSWSRSRKVLHAVDGLSLSVQPRETFSLVGESGCGKTTTARMVLQLDVPTSGRILFRGADINVLRGKDHRRYRADVQAVFQDPSSSLNPLRRVRDIVAEPLVVIAKMRGKPLEERVEELLVAVGLDPSARQSFPHELSGGMRQRVAVAQALALNPALIVLDEPVSALDVSIRAQTMNLLKDLQAEFGVAYLLIAHDLATVRYLSHQVGAMYLGSLVERAPANAFFTETLHPYAVALISAAVPTRPSEPKRSIVLSGEVPSATDPPSGCRFHPRCWLRKLLDDPEECEVVVPELREVKSGHLAACHFAEQLADPAGREPLIAAAADSSRQQLLTIDDAPVPQTPARSAVTGPQGG